MHTGLWRYGIRIGYPVGAFLVALGLCGGLIWLTGRNPVVALRALLVGAFGTRNNLAETALKAIPLMLCGLGMCAAFTCRMWNIGGEGQIYLGALGATVMGLYGPAGSPWLLLPLMSGASFLAGGFWAALPGWLKGRWGVSEIITTIMLNYIAILLTSYAIHVPLRDPQGFLPQSAQLPPAAALPVLIPQTRLHLGLLGALVCAGVLQFILTKTTLGYQLRVVGQNPTAAQAGGIAVPRMMVCAMLISGGLAGMSGMSEIAGVHHRLIENFSPGYGYTAIVVALLAYLQPLGVIVVSILFAGLIVGADAMQRTAGLPAALAYVVQGVVVLCVLGSEYFVRKHLKLAIDD